jgi:mono/diheme cytochrome c family protein
MVALNRFKPASFAVMLIIAAHWLAPASHGASRPSNTAEAMALLKANCLSCHNPEKAKGGLVMTSREALLRGGDSGAVLTVGKPDTSALIRSLAADADPHMPPKKQLTPAQIETLRRWVKEGAKWDAAALVDQPLKPRAVTLAAPHPSLRPVLALALSPDGSRLAVGAAHEVVLFDVAGTNLAPVARAAAHPDPVQSLAWSADGKRLVSGAFRRVVVWDVEPLQAARQITNGLTDRVTALRFVPGGNQFLIADGRMAQDGVVRLADAESGRVSASWTAHGDLMSDLAVSPDGKLLATAGADKLVKLWDLAGQKEIARLENHTAQVLALAFNSNATQLVSGGADTQFNVWDVKTRERIIKLGPNSEAISGAAWLPASGTVLAVTEGGRLFRYTELKAHTGGESSESARQRELESAGVALHALAATPNGERVFAGAHDGRLMVWNKDGRLVSMLDVAGAKPAPVASAPVSFVRDVLPVLSRAGCNAGACHAKPDGQNGFRLTVFSYDPKQDYHEIVKDSRGRRVFAAAPEESLLLLKATRAVPHEGGERFDQKSDAYRTLAQWIRGGMIFQVENEPALVSLAVTPAGKSYRKGATQKLKVEARYSDGSTRDVTVLASYESNDKEIARVSDDGVVSIGRMSGQAVIVARFMGLVGDSRITVPADRLLPEKHYAALPVRNFIDELAYAHFKRLGLFPSEGCTDAEFLRRASLDTLGILPTPDEARAFLADTDPRKREKAVERLLAHPAYADYWANKWADLLRPNPDHAGVKSVYVLDQWLRERFRANTPYDQFVREIVTCEGNTHRSGPAVVYRDKREPAALTQAFSQLFLGVRLECAKCHHHPNEKWGQDDFYRFAAFFGSLKRKGAGISAPISAGNETFYFAPGKSVKHPVTGEVMEPRPPDGEAPSLAEDVDPRRALADWMTDPKNPFFARAAANRVWAAFFGRGIVDPVDDFRISNPPSNPALLDALAEELIRQKFDLKALMRTILNSHLYQLSTTPNEFNRGDTRNFSRSYRRRLPAEVLADAVADVTGVPDNYPGLPPGSRAMQAWTYKIESQTMDAFGRPNSSTDCPCERDTRPSIVQSLHLMNSKSLHAKLTSETGRVQQLASGKLKPEEIVTELYLACYSRPPSDAELKAALAAFNAKDATVRTATEDVLWALLNSAEFVFNH